jgi:hypothetical protein
MKKKPRNDSIFLCDLCSYKTNHRRALSKHIKIKHEFEAGCRVNSVIKSTVDLEFGRKEKDEEEGALAIMIRKEQLLPVWKTPTESAAPGLIGGSRGG